MNTVCEKNKCTGCMACIDKCPKKAIFILDSIDTYNAVINENSCVNCDACHKVCNVNNPPEFFETEEWLQGWIEDNSLRKNSSSGGAATALMRRFVEQNGIVCSCRFKNGSFSFEFADSLEKIELFSGSKYVKSNPHGIYKDIQDYLRAGRKVLFLGLPCQVAAVKKVVNPKFYSQLMLIELICHGTPSPKVLELFLEGYHLSIRELEDIRFRQKDNFDISPCTDEILFFSSHGIQDLYSYTFLNCITYTENCYNCAYAQEKRIADITLGDSWGSALSIEEKKKGISLIMCQTKKGLELVNGANLHLEAVDKEKSIKANRQLQMPSRPPKERKIFFETLKNKNSFMKAMAYAYPKKFIKYKIKNELVNMKLIRETKSEINYVLSVKKGLNES